MGKVYLAAGFQRSTSEEVEAWSKRFHWREEQFGDSGVPEGHIATVEDAPNVQLAFGDRVWINFADRIEAFEHGREFYIVAYS